MGTRSSSACRFPSPADASPDASVATHLAHAVATNGSIATLATMPRGHIAMRPGPGQPWTITALEGWGE
jgi:hypothetical protein